MLLCSFSNNQSRGRSFFPNNSTGQNPLHLLSFLLPKKSVKKEGKHAAVPVVFEMYMDIQLHGQTLVQQKQQLARIVSKELHFSRLLFFSFLSHLQWPSSMRSLINSLPSIGVQTEPLSGIVNSNIPNALLVLYLVLWS